MRKLVLIMSQWCIYQSPSDFPGHYVLRRWDIYRGVAAPVPHSQPVVADSLEAIRQQVPAGLYRIERYAQDDPCIVEVWL